MEEPTRTQWQIRCAFNGFCKRTLKHEAINAHKQTKRQQLREVTFSDLAPHEENHAKAAIRRTTQLAGGQAQSRFTVLFL